MFLMIFSKLYHDIFKGMGAKTVLTKTTANIINNPPLDEISACGKRLFYGWYTWNVGAQVNNFQEAQKNLTHCGLVISDDPKI